MKKYETSRGWRNNNPLNIRRGESWNGLCERQTDPAFCQFMTMSMGYRAAVKVMKSYATLFARQGKAWTVDNILRRWAPENENDTRAYIRRVLQLMGRKPAETRLEPLYTATGQRQLALLLAAMTCIETGCPPEAVPAAALNAGFVAAGLGNSYL